jgi:hypothetical protein
MIIRSWETIKVIYCHHADAEVGMQADVVLPPEWLPDQPPRVLGHRCSHATECNLFGKPSCIWAGTNRTYDPFLEKP